MRIVQKAVGLVLVALLAPLAAHAEGINTWAWQTGNNSNWVTAVNWSLGHSPTNGEIALISNAKVTLTNDTADLGGLVVTNGAILSVYSLPTNGATQWGLLVSVSGTVSIAGNAWIYPYSQNTNGGSAWFRCTSLVVGTNSGFDASEKGFRGALPNENSVYNPPGYGPGRSVGNTYGSAGAGYGGNGGMANASTIAGGIAYGDYTNPSVPGSGTGGFQTGGAGNPGGGLVRVEATDSVIMNGSMLANGANGTGWPGGGSGGGIYIQCSTFSGSGRFSAVGGNDTQNNMDGRNGGAGGGGRIAVIFDPAAQAALPAQPTATFNAAGGTRPVAISTPWWARSSMGRPGSLYFTTNTFFDMGIVQGGTIMVPGVTTWNANNMVFTNGLIAFQSGFTLTVTQNVTLSNAGGIEMTNSVVSIGGDLIVNSDRRASATFSGGSGQQVSIGTNLGITKGWVEVNHQGSSDLSLNISGKFTLDEGYLFFNAHPTNASALNVGISMLATNGSQVYLYSGATNGSLPGYYGLRCDVAGDMTIATNCWVYPYSHNTNGGSVYFHVTNLIVNAGGGIDANGKGFSGGLFGVNSARGFGPGGAPAGYQGNEPGGGYGGNGGMAGGYAGGVTYGVATAPVDPGSGGAAGTWGAGNPGGNGGGLIHVDATETVTVDGSLLANGATALHGYSGSGSGGGIYIACKRFKGAASGTVQAKGGVSTAGQVNPTGAGGGGRIAIIYDPAAQAAVSPQPAVTFNAAGGSMSTTYFAREPSARQAQGRPGSLYFLGSTFFDLAKIQGGTIMVPGISSWSTTTLNASDGLIAFPAGFNLTLSQNLNVTGAGGIELSNSVLNIAGDFIINSDRRGTVYLNGGPNQLISVGGNLSITQGRLDLNFQGTTNSIVTVPGSLAVNAGNLLFRGNPTNINRLTIAGSMSHTNGALVYLYSGMTNATPDYGLLVDVTNDIKLAPNCWIYPYSHNTNGGSVHFRAANLTVSTNAGIDASSKGFAGAFLTTYSPGYGPGRSPGGNSGCTAGAGYGGQGGSNVLSNTGPPVHTGGATYGSSNAPVLPGSGGGSSQNLTGGLGRFGGGLIFVEAAATVIVDGSLLADGESVNGYGGSGSGGGIFINCKEFKGASTGKMTAKGGTNQGGQGSYGSAGGGGGRIAVWYSKPPSSWAGTTLVTGGLGKYTGLYQEGASGTVVFFQKPPRGTMIMVN